jgi:hypothetical protein
MRYSVMLILSVGLLTACDDSRKTQQPVAAEGDLFARTEADIAVGRVEVMQDQVHAGLKLFGASLRDVEASAESDAFGRLQGVIARYNELRSTACARRVTGGKLCSSAPYHPAWSAPGSGAAMSGADLKRMAEEMQNEMMPFWDAVCVKAKARSGNEQFCAIE